MIKKLLPVVFLILGIGAGVAAGVFLMPTKESLDMSETAHAESETETKATKKDAKGESTSADGSEFIKLHSQFVVPIIRRDEVSALVVMSLSIEAEPGMSDAVYSREPKLRDLFLQALFEHANMGGFEGAFTSALSLEPLRVALREVAIEELGDGVVNVLITDLARQDT